MGLDLRREPWRAAHVRLADKHRIGGAVMGRVKVSVVRGGVVAPGALYATRDWDPTDERVAEMLAYVPNHRPEAWAAHAAVITDLVLRLEHCEGPLRDRHWAGTLHAFFTWAEENNYSTDPVELLSDPRISEFIDSAYEKQTTASTHQYRLRNTAALIFPPPPSKKIARTPAQPPHSLDERRVFLDAAERLVAGEHARSKNRRRLHRDLTVILALSFGAGCGSKVLHRVREADLVVDASGALWLTRPGESVQVPVAEPWASILLGARTGDLQAFLLSPHSTGKRNERTGKVLAHCRRHLKTLIGFDTDRAAKCWQVQVMSTAGFDVVAAMCGFKPGTQLAADLIPHLPERDPNEAQAQAVRLTKASSSGVPTSLAREAQRSAALVEAWEAEDASGEQPATGEQDRWSA